MKYSSSEGAKTKCLMAFPRCVGCRLDASSCSSQTSGGGLRAPLQEWVTEENALELVREEAAGATGAFAVLPTRATRHRRV